MILLHFVGLENDPPLFYVGHGQSQLTDPYHLTFAARNEVLFGDWTPFGYHRWDVFKNSLISGVAYLFFSTMGVSRITANLAALFLHLFGLLLFILGLYRIRDAKEIVLTVIVLLANNMLFFYGRLPFLENGLIFLSGLIFFIFVRYHDRIWGQLLIGALIAVAALAGKLFGFLLIGPVVLTLIYKYRSRTIRPALTVLGGLIVTTFAYIFIFYGTDISILTNYYSEQTTGMYGSPPGFSSIPNFFKMLILYGGESGVNEFAPFFILMIILSLILVALTIQWEWKSKQEEISDELLPTIFCAGWLLIGVAGLMPFYYRPIRYALFLFLPGSAICGYALKYVLFDKIRISLNNKWVSLPLIFFFFWYLATQIYVFFCPFGSKFRMGVSIMPLTAVIAIIAVLILYFIFYKRRGMVLGRWSTIILVLIFLAMAVNQARYIFIGLTQSGQYLKQYNTDIAELVDKSAVLTGPYAPAFTIDNDLKAIIYVFGLADVQTDLFDRFPITHIICDRHNWRRAEKDFPFLSSSIGIIQTALRDQALYLFRVPSAKAPPTDFEKGEIFFIDDKFDSALVYFERFAQEYPDNIFGLANLSLSLAANGKIEESEAIIERLLKESRDGYLVHCICGGLYRRLYNDTNDERYEQRAIYHEQRGIELNPKVPVAN